MDAMRWMRWIGGLMVSWHVAVPAMSTPPILSVDDAVVMPGEKTHLVAYVEREPVLGLRKDVEDVTVRFFVGGNEVGHDKTDDDGRASIRCELRSGTARYEARAVVGRRKLLAEGDVFAWDGDRVIIAVDVDDTIARTDYTDLIFDEDEDEIDPLKRSSKTLDTLAADYHIVYLTARPRFLLHKTRVWLREEDFPTGPVITAKGLRQSVRQERFKRKQLKVLRKRWPKLLIGIGNSTSDAEAYGACGLLSIMLEQEDGKEDFGRHSIVLRKWKTVARFFEANRATLADADKLKEAIKGKRMLLQPVRRWDDR